MTTVNVNDKHYYLKCQALFAVLLVFVIMVYDVKGGVKGAGKRWLPHTWQCKAVGGV